LTGMQERAALLGGICAVESAPGAGTTVRVRIPLNEPETCQALSKS
jgi:signal transduction histidine kinase